MTILLDKQKIITETIKNIVKEDDQYVGLCFIGTITSLSPSGKIYAPWTTNQTKEDVDNDQQFWEELDEKITETMGRMGYFVHFNEENVYIARVIDLDTDDLYRAQFVGDYNDFLEDYDLEEYDENALEDYFDEMLNETHSEYEICGIIVSPAEILKTDHIAYREALNNYIDGSDEFFDIGGVWCKGK